MDENEMLRSLAGELGVAQNDPNLDQMDAALRQTMKVAARLEKRGAVNVRLDTDFKHPPAVRRWLTMLADRLVQDGRTCAHVRGPGTASVLFAAKPNVRYCYRCADDYVARLAQRMEKNTAHAWSCDVCGNDTDLLRLTPIVVPFVTILVRGFACADCLSYPGATGPQGGGGVGA